MTGSRSRRKLLRSVSSVEFTQYTACVALIGSSNVFELIFNRLVSNIQRSSAPQPLRYLQVGRNVGATGLGRMFCLRANAPKISKVSATISRKEDIVRLTVAEPIPTLPNMCQRSENMFANSKNVLGRYRFRKLPCSGGIERHDQTRRGKRPSRKGGGTVHEFSGKVGRTLIVFLARGTR
jgi:hypothetical protein